MARGRCSIAEQECEIDAENELFKKHLRDEMQNASEAEKGELRAPTCFRWPVRLSAGNSCTSAQNKLVKRLELFLYLAESSPPPSAFAEVFAAIQLSPSALVRVRVT